MGIEDRRQTALDGGHRAVLTNQVGARGQLDDPTLAHRGVHHLVEEDPSPRAVQDAYGHDRHPDGVTLAPPGHRFPDEVDEADPVPGVDGDDGVVNALEDGRLPAFGLRETLLGVVLGDRHFDGRLEFALLVRLEQVAVRLRLSGPGDRLLVGEGGQEHDGRAGPGVDLPGRLDPVHVPVEVDVHQDQVRLIPVRLIDGVRRGRGHTSHVVAEELQLALDAGGDDPLVVDDQDLTR